MGKDKKQYDMVIKSKYKKVLIRILALFYATFFSSVGLMVGRSHGSAAETWHMIVMVGLMMFPAAVFISLFGYKKITVHDKVITCRRFMHSRTFTLSQIKYCMDKGNSICIWLIDGTKLDISMNGFGSDFSDFMLFMKMNRVKMELI